LGIIADGIAAAQARLNVDMINVCGEAWVTNCIQRLTLPHSAVEVLNHRAYANAFKLEKSGVPDARLE